MDSGPAVTGRRLYQFLQQRLYQQWLQQVLEFYYNF
jgi:hypothetical protein